ncbi:unnamed protein product [Brachionus calyciflorus]|uniref:Coiled-coil domain-containing protein R3HCC1L n=1 Tax=Brachionus calyciflorus TaxID=104777 RepID=A0A813MUW4_9BILA|nr:unnamed protein product [Brachionus calyciflorus]
MTGNDGNGANDKDVTIQKNPDTNGNESEWDSLYDDSGKCLNAQFEKLNLKKEEEYESKDTKKKVVPKEKKNENNEEIKSEEKKIDYLKIEAKTEDEENWDSSVYAHILEIYDFPISFKNENIMNSLKDEKGNQNLSLKWVDDTHCLGIFSNAAEAEKALKLENPMLKLRPISQASLESKRMAKRKIEYLKPYKPRPQTSSFVASRLIGQSLGLSSMLSKDKLKSERDKIKQAKEKIVKEKDLKDSVWNGNV